MTKPSTDDAKLPALLNRHPGLKSRVQALADIAENSDGDLARADEAERRVIEEVRRLRQEALQGWAEGQITRVGEQAVATPEVRRAGRKSLLAHHLRHHRRRGAAVSRGHAQRMFEQQTFEDEWPETAGEPLLVAEIQLDYQSALAQGLPIGSGEIESAHRYIVQQRLKRPGAWWTLDNAEHMLALRLNRANGFWEQYWENCANAMQAA